MQVLLIGDIVGKPGRDIVRKAVPILKEHAGIDFVIANAENAAGGSGITPAIYKELMSADVDAITLGDHIYRRREIYSVLESEDNIVKPANFPKQAPGKDIAIVEMNDGNRIAIVSVLGRVFLKPVDCPFEAVDRVLAKIPDDVKIVIVDMHAEATAEKQLMGRHLDGRVTAVLGTHTHVATADTQILPGGTAFQCDIGMTGPHESILGRRIDRVLETTITFRPEHFEVASGGNRLNGVVLEINPGDGRVSEIRRLSLNEKEVSGLKAS